MTQTSLLIRVVTDDQLVSIRGSSGVCCNMNRFSLQLLGVLVIGFLLLSLTSRVDAETPPVYKRRWEPYYPPGPPEPIVSPETGLPQSWSTVGPEPFFGNPYLWGGYGFGYGWGWYGGRGFAYGALGAYAPFGYGYGGSGYAYPRGPYWSAYRFGPYGYGSWGYGNTGFGDPRYGANFGGPYSGFLGPAQRVPGYRTYGPYSPPADAVVVPGISQPDFSQPGLPHPHDAPAEGAPAQIIAPGQLPAPPTPQGP
jgi:hypothetical protein